MKLRSKLNRGIIILLSLVILASASISMYLFNNSLSSFINVQRRQQFNQITMDLERFSYEGSLTPEVLNLYAQNQDLLIQYYDEDNKLISEFNGLSNINSNEDIELVNIKIDLLDNYNKEIGYLLIQYSDNVFEYDESVKNFRYEMLRNYTILFIFSIIIGSIFVVLFSSIITNPIMQIKEKTKKLRLKDYSFKEKKYNIYELDELSSDIDYLSSTLQMQEKVRVDYAHDIAHELRTPLTNLLLHLEGIQDDIIEADDKTIDLLLNETKRLNKMIDNLEKSFNDNEDLLKLNLEEVELNSLLENIFDSFIPLFNEKNISYKKDLNESRLMKTDVDKITQIISNIISNAIKAVNENGNISISYKCFKNRDVISINDDGIGMTEDSIKHIFERFYRVDNVRNTKISGHGLGLSITKTFIDLLGYNISVNSEIDKGSEFIITIPF